MKRSFAGVAEALERSDQSLIDHLKLSRFRDRFRDCAEGRQSDGTADQVYFVGSELPEDRLQPLPSIKVNVKWVVAFDEGQANIRCGAGAETGVLLMGVCGICWSQI